MGTVSWTRVEASKGTVMDQGNAALQRVQGRMVQHHYSRSQVRDINRNRSKDLIDSTLAALRKRNPRLTELQINAQYEHMKRRLQTAELCINFSATGFFSTPNDTHSYQQMYERAFAKNGRHTYDTDSGLHHGFLLQSTQHNKADERVNADTRATFGKNIRNADGSFDPKFARIGSIMDPGNLVKTGDGEFLLSNRQFNPMTKQVFAALNYARRPHGCTMTYGCSHMVLSNKFKINAIYFAGDTFYQKNLRVSAEDQVSYDTLAGVFGKAKPTMQDQLFQTCVLSGQLPDADLDSQETNTLLEAHIFEPLLFTGNIQEIHLSPRDFRKSPPLTGAAWQNVQNNARAFCVKHGISLILTN